MIYGVHKVINIHGTMLNFFCELVKCQRKIKIKTIGLVHNYIILARLTVETMIEGQCQMVE